MIEMKKISHVAKQQLITKKLSDVENNIWWTKKLWLQVVL